MDDVIFKLEGNDVVAFFPGIPGTSEYDCTCYAHIGQHSSADMGYLASCKPANATQYADLKKELERIGYVLRVVSRVTRRHDDMRREAAKR